MTKMNLVGLVGKVNVGTTKSGKNVGQPYAIFPIYDAPRGQFVKEGNTLKLVSGNRVTVKIFGAFAEAVASTLKEGMKVEVSGNLVSDDFTDRNGNERHGKALVFVDGIEVESKKDLTKFPALPIEVKTEESEQV